MAEERTATEGRTRTLDRPQPLLAVQDIRKAYIGVPALSGIDLTLEAGTVHALVGQNGAGKSTLVRILSGAEAPDEGTITVDGTAHHFRTPQDAQTAGIQTIYQELSLVPQLSVAENVLLGALPRRRLRGVDWAETRRVARAAIERVGFSIDVRAPVASLSVAEQQAVELAKALHKKARVILLDEPTSTLPPPDVKRLFEVLRGLAADGVGMIFISHRMSEVYELCDDISVLRDGKLARSFTTAESSSSDVVSAMVGKDLSGSLADLALRGDRAPRLGAGGTSEVLLSTEGLGDGTKFTDVSLDLHQGEVLGVVGLVGSGQSELASCIAGARAATEGQISVDGRPAALATPREAIRRGIGLLPQDRKASGFVPDMSVAGNITLASLPAFSRLGVRDDRRELQEARRLADRLGMKIASIHQPMKTLSGGTQQKAIFARWLVRSVRILVCDEPTRGVDVGAKEDIYELLRDFAADGGTVVIATSEIPEALMCDRVLVMASGRVAAKFDHDQIDPSGEQIITSLG